ncbi:metalloregulator ArsR/SmtB family transcription factor [Morganella morganii]|uniref:ArsR/SmtB family transcription factor n=1 Tax=Morganella morganii TaxID=582 RepID=UPI0015F521BC|nr:metalloregulator ArsR/SmtB family transcription factor [Morganella morganii]MBA5807131.1 metalloregulator ArsR/SmtB family transcription factor [Morganella morganii]
MSIKALLDEQQLTECAELARALSHPHRINIIQYLARDTFSVEQLAKVVGLSVANTSQHLQQLKRAGLAESEREGKNICYRLANGPVLNMLSALKLQSEYTRNELSSRLNRNVLSEEYLSPISGTELVAGMKSGQILLVDVRPEREYQDGHLPGAVNIPVDQLENCLAQLPDDKEIVAYCRGAYCFLSANAVISLRLKGFRARHFREGITADIPDDKPLSL